MGVLKFLQSDLFKVLLDKVQDFLGYFDNFGAKLNAFLKDPSFSGLVDLFAASFFQSFLHLEHYLYYSIHLKL